MHVHMAIHTHTHMSRTRNLGQSRGSLFLQPPNMNKIDYLGGRPSTNSHTYVVQNTPSSSSVTPTDPPAGLPV